MIILYWGGHPAGPGLLSADSTDTPAAGQVCVWDGCQSVKPASGLHTRELDLESVTASGYGMTVLSESEIESERASERERERERARERESQRERERGDKV